MKIKNEGPSRRAQVFLLYVSLIFSGLAFSGFLWLGELNASDEYVSHTIIFATLVFIFGQISAWGQPQVFQAKITEKKSKSQRFRALYNSFFCITALSFFATIALIVICKNLYSFELSETIVFGILIANSSGKLLQIHCSSLGSIRPLILANIGRGLGFIFGVLILIFGKVEVSIDKIFLLAEIFQLLAYISVFSVRDRVYIFNKIKKDDLIFRNFFISLKIGFNNLPYGLNSELINRVDVIVLSVLASPNIISGYGLVQNAYEAALVGLNALKLVYLPQFTDKKIIHEDALNNILIEIRKKWIYLVFLVCLVGETFFLILVILGKVDNGFVLGLCLLFILIPIILTFHVMIGEAILISHGSSSYVVRNQFITILCKVSLCYFFYEYFGLIGLAFGVSISTLIYASLCHNALFKISKQID